MSPYYQDEAVTIYHGDSLIIAPSLQGRFVIIADPPYGMNWDTNTNRFSGGQQGQKRGKDWNAPIAGDDVPFDPSPWLKYQKVILFGSNHYAQRLPVGTTLVWIKRNDTAFGSFLSDAEVAWMKGGHGVYCFRDVSGNSAGSSYGKVHPTQKTERVMHWCIEKANLLEGETILDPFMGSGTTLRAAKDLGRKAIGIEIEERYCEIAAKRMAQEVFAFKP